MRSWIGSLLLLSAVSVPLFAGEADGLPGGKWWRRPELVNRLGLSGEQQRKLEAISRDSAKQLIDLKGEVEKRAIDLRSELDSEQLDRGRIQRVAGSLSEARARLFERELMLMVDMRNVLSAEQWNQLRTRLIDREDRQQRMRPDGRPRFTPRKQ